METANLEQLTEKIYDEAIQKAEKEAEKILNKAKSESDLIISKAKDEAEHNILAKARKEADLIKSSTESELQLSGKRLMSDLKREITNLISDKILAENIKDVFLDTSFFKEVILEIIKNWGKEDILELHVPDNTRKKIDEGFKQEIAACVKDLTITFDDRIKGGFRISKTTDSYQISFTDEDFIAFFQTYLSKKTRQLLFDAQP